MTRADRVQSRLEDAGVDALLVTDATDLRYLTGFTGSNGLCVVGEGIRRFATDFRYVEQAATQVDGFEPERGPRELLAALSDGWPAGGLRLGFDEDATSVRTHRRLGELVPTGVELVGVSGVVGAVRAVKEPEEIERIAAACALADATLAAVLEGGLAGRTEAAVALDLELRLRAEGAEPSFATIVASAEHGALPHAVPRDTPIAADTLVTIDWGARLDGYCSDCTRTVATGPVASALAELHALVLEAQLAGLAAVAPGRTGAAVDGAARDLIAAAGHGDHFGHSLGHGVGMAVHEAPRLAQTATDETLEVGNVVSVEPGVYVPGLGGVRIEDLVVVEADGARVLTPGLDKGPTVVG